MDPGKDPSRVGRYEIRKELGRGMMGVVYEAWDPALGRRIALKTVKAVAPSRSEREAWEQRFLSEARAAARLSHPAIVVVHDVGRDAESDTLFMALEFLSGETLAEKTADGKALPWRQALEIVARVADALHHAHTQGVVHRDVKPANIMILPSGQPKILDFGIARIDAGSLTMPGDLFGTPLYMSPEQATGEAVDARSDLFSLGAIAWALLTGRAAFEAGSVAAILSRVMHRDPKPPSELAAEIPADVDRVLARAMAKSPEDRYPDGRALAEDVEDVLAGRAPRHLIDWTAPRTGERTIASDRLRADTVLAELQDQKAAPSDPAEPASAAATEAEAAPKPRPRRARALLLFLLLVTCSTGYFYLFPADLALLRALGRRAAASPWVGAARRALDSTRALLSGAGTEQPAKNPAAAEATGQHPALAGEEPVASAPSPSASERPEDAGASAELGSEVAADNGDTATPSDADGLPADAETAGAPHEGEPSHAQPQPSAPHSPAQPASPSAIAPGGAPPAPLPASSGPNPDAGDRPAAKPSPRPDTGGGKASSAFLSVGFEHGLKSGTLEVWVDERRVARETLDSRVRAKLLLLEVRKGSVQQTLPLAPGRHAIRVRVRSGGQNRSAQTAARFQQGATRRLEIGISRLSGKLSLEWK